jgi:aspartyl-tRNA(Asn)/glutamyl-tRNA(Gln) amidotransferase subunit B
VLGTRCEIKNLNSFRFLEEAIKYEVRRQVELIADGGRVVQETRLYDPDKKETRSMRSKEDAHDYRYFPDPDLLPLVINAETIEQIRSELPELPAQRKQRYMSEFGLSGYDSAVLTSNQDIGDYFEGVVRYSLQDGEPFAQADFKLCANWVINEVAAKLNAENLPSWKFGVSDDTLGHILRRLREGTIGAKTAKELFSEFWDEARTAGYERQGGHPELVNELIETRGLKQLADSGAIEAILDEVLAANSKSVEEYRAGKEKAFNALVGQAMKATKGKGNPAQINEILKKKLAG